MSSSRFVRRGGTARFTTAHQVTRPTGQPGRARSPRGGRWRTAGFVLVATLALALPGSAPASARPHYAPEATFHGFQIPAFSGGCVPDDFLPFRWGSATGVTEQSLPGQDNAGRTAFFFDWGPVRQATVDLAGSVTFAWLNLTTFQSGVVSAPLHNEDSAYATGNWNSANAGAVTGTGQIVVLAQTDAVAVRPGSVRPCWFTPSIGTYFVP